MKRLFGLVVLALAAALLLVSGPVSAANLVTNGDFSAGTNGWTFYNIDGAGGMRSDVPHGNYYVLNWNGTATDPKGYPTLTGIEAGATYTVKGDAVLYHLGGPSADSFGVFVDGIPILLTSSTVRYQWFSFETSFKATSSSPSLMFAAELYGSDYAYGIDNIVVEKVAAVPVPAALLLLAPGLALIGGIRRKMNK